MSGAGTEGEPPRKKRRSKWDIAAPDATPTSQSAPPTTSTTPSGAAMAAAAKLNAMLAAQGKLVKSAPAPLLPQIQSVTSPSNTLASSGTAAHNDAGTGTSDIIGMVTDEVEINDLKPELRVYLTKGPTLSELNRTSGAFVSVRGRYLDIVEKARIPREARPLYLHVQGSTKEKVDAAIYRIKNIIVSPLPLMGHAPAPPPLLPVAPLFPVSTGHHPSGGAGHLPGGLHYVQDKVFVGLDQAAESFKLIEKLQGPSGAYLTHIATQSGAKVHLRGRGSGYIEPTSGKESFEALYIYVSHSNQEGLTAARKLCESLIESVKQEFENWKRSQQPFGFGGTAPGYGPPRHPGFGGQPYHHSAYGPPPPHGYGPPPPHGYGPIPPPPPGYHGQPPPGLPPGAAPYGYYPPHPQPPPGGFYGPQVGYEPPPPAYQQPGPMPGALPPPPPPPPSLPPPPNGINYGPPVPDPPKRRFTEQNSFTNERTSEEYVTAHQDEPLENIPEQKHPEMISKTESLEKDDTERKEPEERKEEVEPDSSLAWKPVQPKDVDTSTMPPPHKPPVGHTTKDFQLMPPPSLPAGLMAKGTWKPVVKPAVQPNAPQPSNIPVETLKRKSFPLVAYGDDSSDSESDA